jgi:hypothetical protein
MVGGAGEDSQAGFNQENYRHESMGQQVAQVEIGGKRRRLSRLVGRGGLG